MMIRTLPWTIDFGSSLQNGARSFSASLAPHSPVASMSVRVAGWHMKGSVLPAKLRVSFSSDSSNTVTGYFSVASAEYTANNTLAINNGILIQPNTALTEEDHEYQVPVLVMHGLQGGIAGLNIIITDYNGAAVTIDNNFTLRLLIDADYGAQAYGDPNRKLAIDNYFITSGRR
jgi:hypothetical protein